MIDISYDKNKLAFTVLDKDLKVKLRENPDFRLYYKNALVDGRTVIKPAQKLEYKTVKLTQYRNPLQLFKNHPDSSRYGYLNIHNIGPFKPRELTDKYIIEQKFKFQSPSNYIQIYYHIYFNPANQCQIYLQVYQTSNVETKFIEESTLSSTYTDLDQITAEFISIIGKYSEGSVVFLLGIKMNSGPKSPIIKLLNLTHYNPQFTDKRKKASQAGNQEYLVKQITNIYEFQRCYFIDMSLDLTSREYNPYMNWSTFEQDQFKRDINDYILGSFLPIKLQNMNYLQIPLSYALYETIASNIHTQILRQYRKAKFVYVYTSNKIERNKEKLEGGLYVQAPIDEQKTVLSNVAEGDFFSLYGTIIIARNVSYETDQQLESQKQKSLGVIPKMLKGFLDLRKELQIEEHVKRQSLKQIIVNTYGLFGSEYYSIYNPICSNYIVKVGRESCDIAKKLLVSTGITKTVIQQQTDACLFYLDSIDGSFKQKWNQLNLEINKELDCRDNLFDFKFEYDKYAHKMIIPKAKNTQISLVGPRDNPYIIVKGDLYSEQQSDYRNKVINDYFYKLLTNNEITKLSEHMGCICKDDIHSSEFCYYYLYQQEKQRLENLIQNKQIEQIVKDYSIFVRFSTEESRSLYIQNTYEINASCRCLFFGDRIIPTHLVTTENIQEMRVCETINNILRPIKNVLAGQAQITSERNIIYRKGFEEQINTYNRINEFLQPPLDDQCMLRVEAPNKPKVFISYYFDEIQELIQDNPLKSFHEILHKDINKMYFDIDSKVPINEPLLNKCILEVLAKLLPAKIEPKIHKCTAFSDSNSVEQKYSHHIIIDIKCNKQLNRFVAQQIGDRYQFLTKGSKNIMDMGVYNSNRQSLRLPLCVKIVKDELDRRPFIIQSNSQFKDFIISNTKDCTIEFQQLVHFDKEYPINPARLCEKFKDPDLSDKMIKEIIAQQTKTSIASWRIQDKRIYCQVSYQCCVCENVHDNDNMYLFSRDNKVYINCFSNKQRQDNKNEMFELQSQPEAEQQPKLLFSEKDEKLKVEKKTSYEKIKSIYEDVNEQDLFEKLATQTQNQQHIQFNLEKNTSFIISDMGTGKSQQVKKILENLPVDHSVLCLSFRRTFSIEFANKYGLKNYMDIKGRMNSNQYKKLIVQVDSLVRYDLSTPPQLLIIDEIESILERVYNCKDNQDIWSKFLKLIESSKNVIYMDGLIEKKTIQVLNSFRNAQDWDVVVNNYSPRKDYQYMIIPYQETMNLHILNYFKQLIGMGKRIYGMITSKKLGFYIKEQLQQSGIKVIFYHGSDNKSQEDQDLENPDIPTFSSHMNVKQKHFKNVNKFWKQYQVVLHNSAVTAGVSFDEEFFDLQVNVYQIGTTSPLSFFQGCHRVRNLKDKQVITFLQHSNQRYSNLTPYSIFTKEQILEQNIGISTDYNFSKLKQLQLWLHARQECAKAFQTHILSKYLKRMKYNVVIYNEKVSLEENILNMGLTDCQVKNIEFNRYIEKKLVNIDEAIFKQMKNCEVDVNDQKLFDRDFLDDEIARLQNDVPFYKICKLDIMKAYGMTFKEINDQKLTQRHFKLLWNGICEQEVRNGIKSLMNVSSDPQEYKTWLNDIINNFRVLKNNNIATDIKSNSLINLICLALEIIDHYQTKDYEKDRAKTYIVRMGQILNNCSIMNRMSTQGVSKIGQIIGKFNQFFKYLMIEVVQDQNKLIFKPILRPMFEFICNIKPQDDQSDIISRISRQSSVERLCNSIYQDDEQDNDYERQQPTKRMRSNSD